MENAEILNRIYERKMRRINALTSKYKELEDRAQRMSSIIPMGQPILVGHHSERRDRNYRAKIDKLMRKACELREAVDRASGCANFISSDADNAIECLEAKLEKLEEERESFKAMNKLIRKGDRAGLAAMGLTEETIHKIFNPQNHYEKPGVPSYVLVNLGGRIKTVKDRITLLERKAEMRTEERTENGVLIVKNVEDNRVQLFFKGKPKAQIISELKANGFRWAPSVGCWQRQLTGGYHYGLLRVMKTVQTLGGY